MCSTTPRFSYVCPKMVICACPAGPTLVLVGGATRQVYQGGYTRVGIRGGYREGYTGYYPPSARGSPRPSGAGPDGPAGAGSGGVWDWTRDRRLDGSWRPPSGPGRSCGPPCLQDPRNAASWPIRARLGSISHKVSQNGVVSPEIVYKACHSPYFQNGPQKSPLEFLRFLF